MPCVHLVVNNETSSHSRSTEKSAPQQQKKKKKTIYQLLERCVCMPGTRARSTVMIKVSYHNETQYVKQKKKKKLGNRYRFGFVEDVGGQSAEADGEIGRQLAQLEVRPDGQGRHFLLRNRVTERVDSSTHSTKKKRNQTIAAAATHTPPTSTADWPIADVDGGHRRPRPPMTLRAKQKTIIETTSK